MATVPSSPYFHSVRKLPSTSKSYRAQKQQNGIGQKEDDEAPSLPVDEDGKGREIQAQEDDPGNAFQLIGKRGSQIQIADDGTEEPAAQQNVKPKVFAAEGALAMLDRQKREEDENDDLVAGEAANEINAERARADDGEDRERRSRKRRSKATADSVDGAGAQSIGRALPAWIRSGAETAPASNGFQVREDRHGPIRIPTPRDEQRGKLRSYLTAPPFGRMTSLRKTTCPRMF